MLFWPVRHDRPGAERFARTLLCSPSRTAGLAARIGAQCTATLRAVVGAGPGCPHPGADFAARTDGLGDWVAAATKGSRPWWSARTAVPAGAGLVALLAVAWLARRRLTRAG